MTLHDVFTRVVESVRGLRTSSPSGRPVLDLATPQPALVRDAGGLAGRVVGEGLDSALQVAAGELAPGTVIDCVLPARLVNLRRWPVPNASRAKLRKIVAARANAEMPVAAENLFWSFDVAGPPEGRFVIVHLVRRQYVETLASNIEKAGLVSGAFENEADLLVRLARRVAPSGELLILRRSGAIAVLVEADSHGPRQAYSVSAAGDTDLYLRELSRRWRERRERAEPVRLFLASTEGDEFVEKTASHFGLSPEAFPVLEPEALWREFPAACVMLTSPRPPRRAGLNPSVERVRPLAKLLATVNANLKVAAPIAAFLLVFALIFDFAMLKIAADGMASALGRAQLVSGRIDTIQRKTEMLRQIAKRRVELVDLLTRVASAAPKGVKITEFALTGTMLRLKGEAAPQMVDALIEKLQGMPSVVSATRVSARSNVFEIRCVVRPKATPKGGGA